MANPQQTVPRALKHIWTPIVKNPAAAIQLVNANGAGGVIHGVVVQNLTATAYCFGIFNKNTGVGLANGDLVLSLPLPASGNIIVLPEEFGLVECLLGLCWGIYAAADPTAPVGAFAAINQATVQLAMA